ncbi:MAG TPA: SPW repeat protein [Mucilaginibacter sp.]
MKPFISKSAYGFLNYTLALLLIVSPWVFGFSHIKGAAVLVPIYLGWLQLIMAIFSDNPLGFRKLRVLPIQMHNCVDLFMGLFLMTLPWVYIFSGKIFWPHFLIGLAFLIKAIFTQESPFLTRPHRSLPEAGITSIDASDGRLNH